MAIRFDREGGRGRSRTCKSGRATLAYVVFVPGRDFTNYIALYDSLAAQTGMQRESGSHVEAVCLVVIHLRQIAVSAILNDDVARGAGAIPSARMLEVNAEMEAHIENAFRLPVFSVGQLAGFEFHGSALGQDGEFRHSLSIAKPRTLLIHPIVYQESVIH